MSAKSPATTVLGTPFFFGRGGELTALCAKAVPDELFQFAHDRCTFDAVHFFARALRFSALNHDQRACSRHIGVSFPTLHLFVNTSQCIDCRLYYRSEGGCTDLPTPLGAVHRKRSTRSLLSAHWLTGWIAQF